jgi:hypothetical protein
MMMKEAYSRRALEVAREAIDHAKDAEVAVSDVVAYMVAIYGNRKYQDGFADSRRMEDEGRA